MEQTKEKLDEKITKTKRATRVTSSTKRSVKNAVKKDDLGSTKKDTEKTARRTTVRRKVTEYTNSSKEISKINENVRPLEYYDLPYRYNKTIIKILAQTPHSIFLYWDISDEDRQNFIDKYGASFFNETKPILIVHNKTQNYSFEVEVDDFTNSWYLRTPTSNCVFDVELARKKVFTNDGIDFSSADNRLHITSSNIIQSPNDHVLLDSLNNPVMFKNVKNNSIEERRVTNKSALTELYKDYDFDTNFITNPSSNFRI